MSRCPRGPPRPPEGAVGGGSAQALRGRSLGGAPPLRVTSQPAVGVARAAEGEALRERNRQVKGAGAATGAEAFGGGRGWGPGLG